jgi:Fe-Mn family superoxide dismutase
MFKLPALGYDYEALQGFVGGETMRAHHDHHHQTYVDKLNAAMENVPAEVREKYFSDFTVGNDNAAAGIITETSELAKLLTDLRSGELELPDNVKTPLINHGGGHYNHSLFWQVLTPQSDGEPTGALAAKLTEKYGSFQAFTEAFEAAATGLFGSGWAWLTGDLEIATSANQNLTHDEILLGLDVWEHAYYLDYKWNRADYAKAWWAHVDWDFASARFDYFAK